ncbi:MAG: alpha-galactosidase [Firmicutes bacterium]|nr:alpha-galactosidase [Bacillota bacterium]
MWILETERMAYVMGVDGQGGFQHLYWGDRLPRVSDYPVPAPTHARAGSLNSCHPFESPRSMVYEEYPAWGGIKYTEPCLKASYSDGVRDVVLVYETHWQATAANATAASGAPGPKPIPELTVVLKDPYYNLRVKLHYRLYEEFDLLERYAEIENAGSGDVSLEQVLSGAWALPRGTGYRLTYLAGHWGAETQLRRIDIQQGKFVLESRRGFTSHQANPWFAIDPRERAGEEHGQVWYGALGWSGNWKIVVEHTFLQQLIVAGGINDFDFSWLLEPGEVFTTPAFVGGYTANGFGAASRNMHRFQLEHILPESHRHELRRVLYNSWEATKFDVSEEGQARLAEKAASIGVELFVIDDGWFGARNDDTAGLGDWYVNQEKFPRGLKPLIDKVNSLGMDFGLWVEPEMVNPNSDLYRAHPDWVYHFSNRPRSEQRNQLILNISREDVKEYVFQCLDRLLTENNIKFVKWDANRHFSEPGWPGAPVGREREREIWVRHVQAVYEVLERLRQRHPDVIFESCSGGGGRVDLGILRRVDQVWTSDNTDAFDRLRIQEGFSYVYCPKVMVAWVTDSPNFMNGRKVSLSYRFHSAMMGSLGIGGDLNEWSPEEMELARQKVAEYKEIRHIIQEGELYRLLSPSEEEAIRGACTSVSAGASISAVQYVSLDRSESVVFAFLHSQQFRAQMPRLKLRGLDPEAVYEVTGAGIEGTVIRLSGKALVSLGIEIVLGGDFDSRLIRIKNAHPLCSSIFLKVCRQECYQVAGGDGR